MAFFQDTFFTPMSQPHETSQALAQRVSFADACKGSKISRVKQQKAQPGDTNSRPQKQEVIDEPFQKTSTKPKKKESKKKKKRQLLQSALTPEIQPQEQNQYFPVQSPEMYRGRQPNRTPTHQPGHSHPHNRYQATPNDQQSSPYRNWQPGSPPSQSPEYVYQVRSTSLSAEQIVEIRDKKSAELRVHHTSMLDFLQHYAPAYLAIGRCFHNLPFSARRSENVLFQYREIASETFTAPALRELPDLVYIFGETHQRLTETVILLDDGKLDVAETRLQRCDGLLAEAELRLRFLQGVVAEMWYLLGREKGVVWEEDDEQGRGRGVLEAEWVRKLPEVCFRLGWGGGGAQEWENFRDSGKQ